jgi:sirohydrochlorin ferrochelatase
MPDNPIILLVDNGSVKVEATLQLRMIAKKLSERVKQQIHPVSLQHAEVTLAPFLREQLQRGKREFILLPLFFGNSRALTKFIPDVQTQLEEEFTAFNLKIADTLFPLPQSDVRLADIIFDNIQTVAKQSSLNLKNIVLVDHGSPSPEITAVRNAVTEQVQSKLGKEVQLEQAAMERRSGKQYDFNGELLEDWLIAKAENGEAGAEKSAIVTLLFSLPGRHAGEGGDIVTICESVMHRYPNFKIGISPLVGEHPRLLDILADRLNSIQES